MVKAEPLEPDRRRSGLRALFAAGTATWAIRTLVRQVAKRSLGPVALLITAGEAAVATRSALRALSRWRRSRRLRHSAPRR